MNRKEKVVVGLLMAWLLLSTSAVTVAVWKSPVMRAVLLMGWGLIILWIILGGCLMYGWRDVVRLGFKAIPRYTSAAGFLRLLTLPPVTTPSRVSAWTGSGHGPKWAIGIVRRACRPVPNTQDLSRWGR